MDDRRKKALSEALGQLEKQFGKGVVRRLDATSEYRPCISTGLLALDVALGCGGFPKSRIVEIYGNESSGKTTLTLQAIARVQASGGTAAFIDVEHALDPEWAEKNGVRLNELLVSQPDTGEAALEIAERLTRTSAVDLVVIDSVAALVSQAELSGEMGDSHVGLTARLLSQAMRKLTGAIAESGTCMIFINQIRMKIGGYGNPETTTGGNALKFYASQRLEVRKGKQLSTEDAIGNYVKIKVAKNKVGVPFRKCELVIRYDRGLSEVDSLLDVATEQGVIEKSGAWYSYDGEQLGQGRDNTISALETSPAIADVIYKATLAKLREAGALPTPPATRSSSENAESEEREAA